MAMNYYLGVKTVPDAAKALGRLSFVRVLDPSILKVLVPAPHDRRIILQCGPASSDDDLSKGVMILLIGMFTSIEMQEIDLLSNQADPIVTDLIMKFVETKVIPLQKPGQDSFNMHIILQQDLPGIGGSRYFCAFCKKMIWSKGLMKISGSNAEDVTKVAQLVSAIMLSRKCVCISCSSMFCVECGNTKGRSLDSGGTHCPKCGTKVPIEKLI
jgi:hypothetical protein